MTPLIRANSIAFAGMLIASILPLHGSFFGRVAQSLIDIVAIVLIPGVNLAFLFEFSLGKTLKPREMAALSAASSFFVVPLLIALEYSFLGSAPKWLPIFNAACIFAAIVLITLRETKSGIEAAQKRLAIKTFLISRDTFFAFSVSFLVAINIVTAFLPLPDLDPYYWLTEMRRHFSLSTLEPLSGYRSLFSAYSFLFAIGAHIDTYAFFKYVLPFSILFTAPPLLLLAGQFRKRLHRIIILLMPFANGIGITYLMLPIPQALASVALFFSVSFLIYSHLRRDMTFFALSGASLAVGYFYHESLAIPLLIWIAIGGFGFRKQLWSIAKRNALSSLLLAILILPHLTGPLSFVHNRIQSTLSTASLITTNLTFPKQYTNIDGNQMGWQTLSGIAKYYAFYLGPTLAMLFIAIASFRNKLRFREYFFSRSIAPISVSLLAFVCVAEILPRFANVAILPDRAWIFIGILSLALVPYIFSLPLGNNRFFLWILIFSFSLNIGGALFINTLKKYLITEPQLSSAQWIKDHLPENRVIFTDAHKRLLQLYSDSETTTIRQDLFFDPTQFDTLENAIGNQRTDVTWSYRKEANRIIQCGRDLAPKDPLRDNASITLLLQECRSAIDSIQSLENSASSAEKETSKHRYIYYAAPDKRSPYIDRPYMRKIPNGTSFTPDTHPNIFKKIYSDTKNQIFIWEILEP